MLREQEELRKGVAAVEIVYDRSVGDDGESAAARKDAERLAARQAYLANEAARQSAELAAELEEGRASSPRGLGSPAKLPDPDSPRSSSVLSSSPTRAGAPISSRTRR